MCSSSLTKSSRFKDCLTSSCVYTYVYMSICALHSWRNQAYWRIVWPLPAFMYTYICHMFIYSYICYMCSSSVTKSSRLKDCLTNSCVYTYVYMSIYALHSWRNQAYWRIVWPLPAFMYTYICHMFIYTYICYMSCSSVTKSSRLKDCLTSSWMHVWVYGYFI
jgi:hypothetical protein